MKSNEVGKAPVYHSQELVDASYTLTRDQKRILWLYLADIERAKEMGINVDSDNGVLEFSLKAYQHVYEVDPHEASRDVRVAMAGYKEREVRFYLPEESTATEMATDEIPWLAKRSYRPRRGFYVVYFNPYLVPYLKGMKERVGPRFKEIDKLTNPLHSRLYTKLLEGESTRECVLQLKWMLERFELPATYTRYSNFKQKFLIPCIEKLKQLEGMKALVFFEIKDDPTKKRLVTAIRFKW